VAGRSQDGLTPALAVVGQSGAGKTTLIEGLVAEFARRGLRVATVKHTHHRIEDRPDSDSARHRRAGAAVSLLAGPAGFGWWGWEPEPERLLAWLSESGVRLVVVEGYKHGPFPRLEVARGDTEPVVPLEELWGLATDRPRPGVVCFALTDYCAMADAVLESDLFAGRGSRRRGPRPGERRQRG
jgi:molybdopterin-guanine dinucleotide biosynthesis protein MobB